VTKNISKSIFSKFGDFFSRNTGILTQNIPFVLFNSRISAIFRTQNKRCRRHVPLFFGGSAHPRYATWKLPRTLCLHPEYPVPGRTPIPSHLPCPLAASPFAPFAKRESLASERERKESRSRAGGRIEFLIERERERERECVCVCVCMCVCDRRDRD
jgi:hypothetical protein